jgi:hypothetical protein
VAVNCSGLTTACTLGVCQASTGMCQALPTNQGGDCNDNNRCTNTDRCNAGVCSGTPIDCSALNNACNVGTCNTVSGLCQTAPANNGAFCNDGYPCTTGDACMNGTCVGNPTQPELVNLLFSPTSGTVMVGSTIQLGLIAQSATCFPQDIGSVQVILSWDPTRLQLMGHLDNGPYAWVSSAFPNDSSLDGLNAPYGPVPGNDGTAWYVAVASFVEGAPATPAGLLVTTFQFQALTATPSTSVSIISHVGSFTYSDVLGEGIFNSITGTLGTSVFNVVQCLNASHCNDGNVCTTDACVGGACVNSNNTSPCDDGQYCTVTDVCSGGACVGSGARCSVGLFCSEPTDSCVQCLQDSHCNDGNACTTDTCSAGVCTFTNNTEPCDDGFFCTPTDMCLGGSCLGSGQRCPGQFCNETTDACVQCLNAGHCGDGNVCTNDSCVAGVCQYTNTLGSCNDGQFCTAVDSCSGGACVGSGGPCSGGLFCSESTDSCVQCLNNGHCSDGNACTDDVCSAGTCVYLNNSLPCEDGAFCTTGDQCAGGSCAPGTGNACPGLLCDEPNNRCVECFVGADCIDGFSCTSDSCQNGICQYVTNDAVCNDSLFCTGIETCQVGVGCLSSGSPCDSPALCDEPGDYCRCPSPLVAAEGPRYVRVTPAPGTVPVALRLDSTDPDLSCLPKYVAANGALGGSLVFQLPAAWGMAHVSARYVEPSTPYTVRSDCRTLPTGPENLSPPVLISTNQWGDLNGSGDTDVSDVLIVLDAFAAESTMFEADLVPCDTDRTNDVADILAVLSAFGSQPYSCPLPCP